MHDKCKDLVCDTCGYRTANMSNLRAHVKHAHQDRMPICCDQCDYRTYHAEVLQRHIRQVSGSRFMNRIL